MKPHHHYSEEEKAWLISQDISLTYKELTKRFNDRFGTDISPGSISDLMSKRLKIKRTGNTKKSQFKQGAKEKYPVGSEIIKDGYVYVKVDNKYFPGTTTANDYAHNWKRKSNIIWEAQNGKIPKGMFIVFLDGNPLNCNIDNLYLTTRTIHAMMSKNRWYKINKEFTVAALKYCELIQAKKEVSHHDNHI